jgi:hypothetical protein
MSVVDGFLKWVGALPPESDVRERRESRKRLGERRAEVFEARRGHEERVEKARAMLEAVRSAEDPPLTFEDFMHAIEGQGGGEDADGED